MVLSEKTVAYIAIGRAVKRLPSDPNNFDVGELVRGVRTFNHDAIRRGIKYIYNEFVAHTKLH